MRSLLAEGQEASAEFLEEISHKPKDLSQKMSKGWVAIKLAPRSKKFELNCTNLKQIAKSTPRLHQKA
jgi:hypothetical protein